jgi:PRTRC genetic system protein C
MTKPRVFLYNGTYYEDPNPAISAEQVRDMLARTFGAIAGGEVLTRDETERTVVEFRPRPQRKGAGEGIVYTFGYSKHSVADLQAHMKRTGAIVVDIRYNPHSRRPEWRQEALRKALHGRYTHIRALGNKNYNVPDAPIRIADMATGMALLKTHATLHDSPVILMCGCSNPHECHRHVVALELLRRNVAQTLVHLE